MARKKNRFVAKKGFINFDALKWAGLSASDVDFSSKKWKRIQSRYQRGKSRPSTKRR
jgi:hypothetical protein